MGFGLTRKLSRFDDRKKVHIEINIEMFAIVEHEALAQPKPNFCITFGMFWPIFDSFCGGSIRSVIQPTQKESKISSKEP